MLEKKHLVFLAGATAPFAPPAMYGPGLRLLHYKCVFLAFHNQASNGLTFHDLFFPWESRLILGYSMRIGHLEY